MTWMTFGKNLESEAIKAGFGLLLLLFTWFVGYRIIARWDKRKKQQELDIAISTQFQQLFGEFKEISKLWEVFYNQRYQNQNKSLDLPAQKWEELLKRATTAESKLEAILVKLATEWHLSQAETKYLGLFRQGFQQLRESIRDDRAPTFEYKVNPEYHLFNELVCEVANIVSERRSWKQVPSQEAKRNLGEIVEFGGADWPEAVRAYSKCTPLEEIALNAGKGNKYRAIILEGGCEG
jgi:hypothetical protein